MPDKTYYSQFKDDIRILDFVKHFQRDFTFHARKKLAKAKNFIAGARPTGFDVHDLDERYDKCLEDRTLGNISSCDDYKARNAVFLFGNNERFWIGSNGKIREITRDEAMKIYDRWINRAEKNNLLVKDSKLYGALLHDLRIIVYNRVNNILEELRDQEPSNYFIGVSGYENDSMFRDAMLKLSIDRYLKMVYKRGINGTFSVDEQKNILNDLSKYRQALESSVNYVVKTKMPALLERVKKKYPPKKSFLYGG